MTRRYRTSPEAEGPGFLKALGAQRLRLTWRIVLLLLVGMLPFAALTWWDAVTYETQVQAYERLSSEADALSDQLQRTDVTRWTEGTAFIRFRELDAKRDHLRSELTLSSRSLPWTHLGAIPLSMFLMGLWLPVSRGRRRRVPAAFALAAGLSLVGVALMRMTVGEVEARWMLIRAAMFTSLVLVAAWGIGLERLVRFLVAPSDLKPTRHDTRHTFSLAKRMISTLLATWVAIAILHGYFRPFEPLVPVPTTASAIMDCVVHAAVLAGLALVLLLPLRETMFQAQQRGALTNKALTETFA